MHWFQHQCRKYWPIALLAALVVGGILRLVYGNDIEYKYDEAWTFENAVAEAKGDWRWFGMESSTKAPNPGMSVWVFTVLGKLGRVVDPPGLVRTIQILNILALVSLVLFARRLIPSEEREPWYWAAALAAVNPLAVLFQRKIWPPSVLPLLSLGMLAGWWRRECLVGAFVWGLVGACLGQIHMSGFFVAAALAGWTAIFRRQNTRWLGWIVGTCLGLVPLVPWIREMTTESGRTAISTRKWYTVAEMKFWTNWVSEPLGLTPQYTLGRDFGDYLSYPIIGGRPTYVVGFAHLVLVAVGVIILSRAAHSLWSNRTRWRELVVGRDSTSAFVINACLWGCGLLLTATGSRIYRHYLLVLFPLTFVWLARLALGGGSLSFGRSLLCTICVAQAITSAAMIGYVHSHDRTIRGDYGMPYRVQQMRPDGPFTLSTPSADSRRLPHDVRPHSLPLRAITD